MGTGSNGWTNRIGIAGLAAVACVSMIGATVITAAGKQLPDGFFNIGAAAVGALAGLLYQRQPSQTVVTHGPDNKDTIMKVQ